MLFSCSFSFNSNKWTALCDLLQLSLLAASGLAPRAGTLANEDQHRWRKLISFNSVRASRDRNKSEAQSYFWTEINYWSLFYGDRCQKGWSLTTAASILRPNCFHIRANDWWDVISGESKNQLHFLNFPRGLSDQRPGRADRRLSERRRE